MDGFWINQSGRQCRAVFLVPPGERKHRAGRFPPSPEKPDDEMYNQTHLVVVSVATAAANNGGYAMFIRARRNSAGNREIESMSDSGIEQPAPISAKRVKAMQGELRALSQLNAAMSRIMFGGDLKEYPFYSRRFDRTDSKADNCESRKEWDMSIDGDFAILRIIDRCVYIVVGDSTGRHAYAGGLRVFISAALQKIFNEINTSLRPPSATRILADLNRIFFEVGAAIFRIEPGQLLDDGADMVVVRIDTRPKGAITFASAGIPVLALDSAGGVVSYGKFRAGSSVAFPRDFKRETKLRLDQGTIDTHNVDFIAVVTDGFQRLGRRPRTASVSLVDKHESFGENRVKGALASRIANTDKLRFRPSADQVADALIDAARAFRDGYCIPELDDDDRLSVVVDLVAARDHLSRKTSGLPVKMF
jgi:hypothetical protein